ncbi:hypothetical protein LNP15_04240 [Fructobacillus sp. M131]|nr:hypothetical protein [Fructobacillus cardui]MCK8627463.1 hypothetical protein [Fructobacillus cardui]
MTELQSNFLFKFGELLIVIAINYLLTKQQLYFSRQFHWLDYVFCFVIILMAVPFLPTKDLTTSIAVGLMGGFSEEFLARGVLLGKMTSYFVRKKYSLGRIFAAIFLVKFDFCADALHQFGPIGTELCLATVHFSLYLWFSFFRNLLANRQSLVPDCPTFYG